MRTIEQQTYTVCWILLGISIACITFSLISCGPMEYVPNTFQCSVVEQSNVATISCPDGSRAMVTGATGANGLGGSTGITGQFGANGAIGATGLQGITGITGTIGMPGISGVTGQVGASGQNGVTGSTGQNGYNAAFSETSADHTACPSGGTIINMGIDINRDGILQSNEILQVTIVCNGQNAPPTQLTPVASIMPCGPNSSSYKEVLLGLEDGTILSEFTGNASNAATVRNTLVPDGSYYDTDDSECYFTIQTSQGNRSVIWNGTSANHNGVPYHAGQANYSIATQNWTVTY